MSTGICLQRNVRWYEKRYLKGYKLLYLCRGVGPTPYSAMSVYPHGAEYAVGLWTSRKYGWGPLGVFASAQFAKEFGYSYAPAGFLLAECYYAPSPDNRFWKPGYRPSLCAYPLSTRFADRLILTHILDMTAVDAIPLDGLWSSRWYKMRGVDWQTTLDAYREAGGKMSWARDPQRNRKEVGDVKR